MKVTIVEDPHIHETEISIVCAEMTDALKDMVANLAAAELTFAGKKRERDLFHTCERYLLF